MGDESPFPSNVEAGTRVREKTRLSLAVGDLLARRDHIAQMLEPLLEEHRTACTQVAEAEHRHAKAEAEAYLNATGPVEERKRRALLDPVALDSMSDLGEARMARRICEKAMRVREKDLDVLTALAHAHNREIKVLEG